MTKANRDKLVRYCHQTGKLSLSKCVFMVKLILGFYYFSDNKSVFVCVKLRVYEQDGKVTKQIGALLLPERSALGTGVYEEPNWFSLLRNNESCLWISQSCEQGQQQKRTKDF